MYITDLKLKNFRNYGNQILSFSEERNIIFGRNAQGKTNVLEAIFLCSTGRSHRTYRDFEMISASKDALKVELILNKKILGVVKIEIEIGFNGKKGVKINEIPIRKIGELMGHLNVVIFSPEDVGLVKGEPQNRRRFLDMFISQIKPSYFFNVQQYNKALRQRNALLKQIKERTELLDTLEAWNVALAKNGARIMNDRRYFINELGKSAKDNYIRLAGNTEELCVSYIPMVKISEDDAIDKIELKFLQGLEKSLENDIARLSTQLGPHRDDFLLVNNEKELKTYGSQGQQRSCSLALKMAQVDVMEVETGDIPILLLDDVMSELDRERRQNLSKNMKKAQTFITCTDSELFDNEDGVKSRFFQIEAGQSVNIL